MKISSWFGRLSSVIIGGDIVIKAIGKIEYILYNWSNVKWAWARGIYGVHPNYEQEFIVYVKKNKLA